jgi:hypothetical protein
MTLLRGLMWFAFLAGRCLFAQAIEFESGGLKYLTLTRNGLTIMFAHLPSHVRDYSVLQIAVSNGSRSPVMIRPQDFRYEKRDGAAIQAAQAVSVIRELMERGSRNDVIRLVGAYEQGIYGMTRFKSTNGYEQRRQQALTEFTSVRLKAAAAASAIALVPTKLAAGESTDGAIFFPNFGRPLPAGRLKVVAGGESFEFETEGTSQ